MAGRLGFYAGYAWRTLVLGQADPLIFGIAVTDHCNLACKGCRVMRLRPSAVLAMGRYR